MMLSIWWRAHWLQPGCRVDSQERLQTARSHNLKRLELKEAKHPPLFSLTSDLFPAGGCCCLVVSAPASATRHFPACTSALQRLASRLGYIGAAGATPLMMVQMFCRGCTRCRKAEVGSRGSTVTAHPGRAGSLATVVTTSYVKVADQAQAAAVLLLALTARMSLRDVVSKWPKLKLS